MKNYLLFFLFLNLIACQSQQSNNQSNTDPTTQFAKLDVANYAQQLKATPNPQLIDVRTPEEFQEGHIEGAKNINYYLDDFTTQLEQLDKTKAVFVYCKSGGRSGKSFKQLQELGFSSVYDLKGGYTAWAKANQ